MQPAPVIDGELDEYSWAPSIVTERWVVDKLTGKEEYAGARVWLGWDEANVYVAAEVLDREHYQTRSGSSMWEGDSIQLGFHDVETRTDSFWKEYVFGIGPQGGHMFHWSLRRTTDQTIWAGVTEGPVAGGRFAARRQRPFTLYEAAIPLSHVGLEAIKPGVSVRAAMVVFDRAVDQPLTWSSWAGGITGGKDLRAYGQLTFTDRREQVSSSVATEGSLVPDFSFEQGAKNGNWGGNFAVDDKVAFSGRRCVRLDASHPARSPVVAAGDVPIEPNRNYRLRAMVKGTLVADALRLRVHLKDAGRNFTLTRVRDERSVGEDWHPVEIKFPSGEADRWLWFCVEVIGPESGLAWVDDVVVREVESFAGPLKEPRVLLVTDNPASAVSHSLRAMNAGAVRLQSPGSDMLPLEEVRKFGCMVVALTDQSLARTLDRSWIRGYAESGGTVYMDLSVWAAMRGLQAGIVEMPDPANAPDLSNEQAAKLAEKVAGIYGRKQVEAEDFPDEWMQKAFVGLEAEMAEAVPRIRVVANDRATAGFPPGSLVPWGAPGAASGDTASSPGAPCRRA